MALSHLLEDLGCRVVGVASTAEECLEMAAETPLDFVVLDVRLIGPTNGLELAELLRASSDLPIVFTSAYSVEELSGHPGLTGEIHFVPKPVNDTAMRRIVEGLRRNTGIAD
jgi:CheY-like chemotaxis protein